MELYGMGTVAYPGFPQGGVELSGAPGTPRQKLKTHRIWSIFFWRGGGRVPNSQQGRRHRGGSGGSRPPSCQPGPFLQNLQERTFGNKR